MMRWETPPNSRNPQALHTPSATSAAMKMRKLSRSLLRRFILPHFLLKLLRWFLRFSGARIAAFERHDLHGRVARLVQEAVDDRPAQQNVPTGARRLAENHVRDALAPRKINQRIGDVIALQFNHLRAEFFGET